MGDIKVYNGFIGIGDALKLLEAPEDGPIHKKLEALDSKDNNFKDGMVSGPSVNDMLRERGEKLEPIGIGNPFTRPPPLKSWSFLLTFGAKSKPSKT